ncbi:MAG: YfiM family protein [Bernardetiaceae bacterium]|nr:YfiM family protein [Bernardetiaceae bacterium]
MKRTEKMSRRTFLGCLAVTLAALVYYLLDQLWYAAIPRRAFQWFDDSRDWQQMDKAGHVFSAYHLSRIAYSGLQWAGVAPKKAQRYAAAIGFAALAPIELLDAFAVTHGASLYDLIANALGASFFTFQQEVANKQVVQCKFWFTPSPYAALRPDKLGKNFIEQLIKDYNGQTYWLSVPGYFLPDGYRWIRLAVGYGATGMIYGNPEQNQRAGRQAQRHFYVGLDMQLPDGLRQSSVGKFVGFFSDLLRLPLPCLKI